MDFRQTDGDTMTTDTMTATAEETMASDATIVRHGARNEPFPLEVDHGRDALLTDFGKETLKDRYLLPGESYQDLFVRVASAYADDAAHAQRLYDYISKLWFMPATPVLSNGGTGRGLPSPAISIPCPTASTASCRRGTRMCGWRRVAAGSAPIGAMCAGSASRSA